MFATLETTLSSGLGNKVGPGQLPTVGQASPGERVVGLELDPPIRVGWELKS